MRPFFIAAVLGLCSITTVACQGLATALGVQPSAEAPVFNGVGVVAMPGAWVDTVSNPDQSGNVAAKGDGEQVAEQRQVTQLDPAAIAKGIAEAAAVVVPGGRAAAALARAEEALAGGDLSRADKLAKAAKGFAGAEKAAAEPEAPAAPSPAPRAPTAPATPATPADPQ